MNECGVNECGVKRREEEWTCIYAFYFWVCVLCAFLIYGKGNETNKPRVWIVSVFFLVSRIRRLQRDFVNRRVGQGRWWMQRRMPC